MNIPALKEIIEERKEKAIETLSDCFAKNRLPLEEYERIVEYIHKTESERELAVVEKIVAEYCKGDEPSGSATTFEDDEDYDDNFHHSGGTLNVLSTRTFSGPLESGMQFANFLGSTRIRVKKSDLAGRKTHVSLTTILGDYAIFVDPGIRVINNAVPILGSTRVDHKVNKEAQNGSPEIIISGAAILGDIRVKLLRE